MDGPKLGRWKNKMAEGGRAKVEGGRAEGGGRKVRGEGEGEGVEKGGKRALERRQLVKTLQCICKSAIIKQQYMYRKKGLFMIV